MLIKRKRSYGYFLSYKLSDIYGSKQTENCKMKNASEEDISYTAQKIERNYKKLLTKVRNIVIAYFPKV